MGVLPQSVLSPPRDANVYIRRRSIGRDNGGLRSEAEPTNGASMTEAFICDYVRTPIGRFGGALASLRADDLAALPIRELIAPSSGSRR